MDIVVEFKKQRQDEINKNTINQRYYINMPQENLYKVQFNDLPVKLNSIHIGFISRIF